MAAAGEADPRAKFGEQRVLALGGVAVADIPHAEYDRLYVVVHEAGKPPRVVETRYGAR